MSGAAAPHAGNNIIDLSSPGEQPWKRLRRDGSGSARNARRNGAQGTEQVIDLTHVPDMLDQRGAAAGHARDAGRPRHLRTNNAEVPAQRRDADRANRRPRVAGAAAGAQPQRSPGAAVQGMVPMMPAVVFPYPMVPPAAPAQPQPAHASTHTGKRKHMQEATAAAPPPPEEENAPTCAICLDPLKANLCCAPCGHVFHHKCLKESIIKFKYCPTCRKPIKKESQIKKIFL